MMAEVQTSIKNPILVRERLAALVRASVEVFASKGFHASRVSDVVKLAGISQGAAYNYVKSKEDLLYLVCRDYLDGYRRILTAALRDADGPRDRLLRLLTATVRVTREYRKHHLVLQRELHCLDRQARAPFLRDAAEFRRICQEILVGAAGQEGLHIEHPRLAANLLIHFPSVIVMRRWDIGPEVTDDQVDAGLISFMLKGIGLSVPEATVLPCLVGP